MTWLRRRARLRDDFASEEVEPGVGKTNANKDEALLRPQLIEQTPKKRSGHVGSLILAECQHQCVCSIPDAMGKQQRQRLLFENVAR